jgi:hypothetical protein
MKKMNLKPNFFVSEPYLELAGAEVMVGDGWVWLDADGVCMFPPYKYVVTPDHDFPLDRIWSDFDGFHPGIDWQPEFLDHEYIFDPNDFNAMDGGKWNTFRKNVRKWPREHPEWLYVSACYNTDEATELVADWLDAKQEDVQDGELMARFALLELDERIHRRFMYYFDAGRPVLVGINAWDDNWEYINYRICMVKAGERFLDEFMRYQFYTDPEIQWEWKLVNDGGTLGNAGLERFKDKMNPKFKRTVYSWTKT